MHRVRQYGTIGWTLAGQKLAHGQSRRFATRADACSGLQQAMRATPHTRIDAGLGQISLLARGEHRRVWTCALHTREMARHAAPVAGGGFAARRPSPLKS